MRNFLKKLKKPNIFLPIFLLAILAFWPHIALAGVNVNDAMWGTAVYIVGNLVQVYVSAIGWIVVQLISLLVIIAQYNEFVTSPAITEGWVIVRDVVNMFFIIILLVIAFATIFNIEEYKYQKLLPRLLIMAIVINFSRTIAGILIDFGQVVMLTFVNGFQAAAGGNFLNALKINDLLKYNTAAITGKVDAANLKNILAAYILAAIMITVTLVVIVVMLFILIMRIVTLWFLVILSPLAFLASVWPSSRIKQKYSQWWDMFLDNIMVGPILAFFLWLSLLVLGQGNISNDFKAANGKQVDWDKQPKISISAAGSPQSMISYLMGIGMLIGSLYMAQSMRSVGSGIAGSALGKMQGFAKSAVKKGALLPVAGVKKTAGAGWEKSGGRAYKDALVSKVRTSKFGKAVGLGGKDYTEGQKALRDEKALRRVGMTGQADALRTKLAVTEKESIAKKGLTNVQIRENYKGAGKGSIEKEALAREMADRGLIRNSSDFKQYSGGDKRLEFALRSSARKSRDKEAFVGYQEDSTKPSDPKKDIEDIYHHDYTTSGQRQQMFTDIQNGAMLGKDGKLNQEFALEKLATLEKDDFEHFTPAVQEKVKNSFVLAQANDANKFKELGLENKFNKITGGRGDTAFGDTVDSSTGAVLTQGFSTAKKNDLLHKQALSRSQSRLEASQTGTLEKTDLDDAVIKTLEKIKSVEKDSGQTDQGDSANDLYTALNDVLSADSSSVGNIDIEKIQNNLLKKAKSLDNKVIAGDISGTGQHNQEGTELNYTSLLKGGRFYKGLEDAKEIVKKMQSSGVVTTEDKKAAAAAINVSIKDMEVGTSTSQDKYVESTTNYKKAAVGGLDKLGEISSITDSKKRIEALNQALFKLSNALNIVEKNADSYSQDVLATASSLKDRIADIRSLGSTVGNSEIDELKSQFENLRHKV